MSEERRHICLGLTDELYPEGTHICYLYNDDEERRHVLPPFVRYGLQEQDSVIYLADTGRDELPLVMENLNIMNDVHTANGQFEIMTALDAYCAGGHFEPDAMLELLRQWYLRGRSAGFAGVRCTGEMSWAARGMPGAERVIEYESRINNLVEEVPLTVMCQYDARKFDGGMIFDVLNVHPIMIIRGHIIRNPFYFPPEKLTSRQHAEGRQP